MVFLVLWDQKRQCSSLTRSNGVGSSPNDKWAPSAQQKDRWALGSCCCTPQLPRFQAESAYVNNCTECSMRPLVASLCSAKWMHFTPFELRKVWSFGDVNWAPLSLSSSFGIPYPVKSLFVRTGEREFHNRLWPFSRGDDCIQSLGKPTLYFCSANIRVLNVFM